MTVQLVGRARPDPLRLSTLQVQLLVTALIAGDAPDRDLLAPRAYVPSQVCAGWSQALFDVLPDLAVRGEGRADAAADHDRGRAAIVGGQIAALAEARSHGGEIAAAHRPDGPRRVLRRGSGR